MSTLQIKSIDTIDAEGLPMVGSDAIGLGLVKDGKFAADYLSFQANQKTTLHTHPGDHILIVYVGNGWLDFDGNSFDISPGVCYFVPGNVPHRIRAGYNGLGLFSIANDHRLVDSQERLEIVDA